MIKFPELFQSQYESYKKLSLLSPDRLQNIISVIESLEKPNEYWECGVYQGGTALILANYFADNQPETWRFFDTFSGIPFNSIEDNQHQPGDFKEPNIQDFLNLFGRKSNSFIYSGIMPDTFSGLENSKISVAHVDVDVYKSVLACLGFIYPRLSPSGFIIIDDYGAGSCIGARKATDKFLVELHLPLYEFKAVHQIQRVITNLPSDHPIVSSLLKTV